MEHGGGLDRRGASLGLRLQEEARYHGIKVSEGGVKVHKTRPGWWVTGHCDGLGREKHREDRQ